MLGAIEAGGTKVVVALADSPRADPETTTIPTTEPRETLARLRELFAGAELEALGIGSFGPVDVDPSSPRYGTILDTPKPGWKGVDWIAELRGDRPFPVAVETDVGAAALGEIAYGAAREMKDVVYVTVGTGIGAGVVSNGRLVHGVLHPEIGHLRLRRSPDDDFAGICPFHGDCLEGTTSGPAIAARAGRPAEKLPEDDPCWTHVEHALGELVAALVLSFAPQRIVLGGGVAKRSFLFPGIRARATCALAGYLAPGRDGDMKKLVVPAALGHNAGIVGALVLARSVATPVS